jgi:antirestriction protein ArdC
MPPFSQFKNAKSFYSVMAHETTHWSGAKPRLARDLTGRFGSESYAMEELIAELGAAFLGGMLNLPSEPRRDHAPYITSWLKVLKNDSRAIFTAATKAQDAADYLASFSQSEA